jgi:2-oxoglutarate/2-oxoacid ferredoxin oxidoreductase subunit alpha
MEEALDSLRTADIHLDAMRLRAFPFAQSVKAFIDAHDTVFVVEQNRDAQMHTLLVTELELHNAGLVKVLHYDGTPITARFIVNAIQKNLSESSITKQAPATRKETA